MMNTTPEVSGREGEPPAEDLAGDGSMALDSVKTSRQRESPAPAEGALSRTRVLMRAVKGWVVRDAATAASVLALGFGAGTLVHWHGAGMATVVAAVLATFGVLATLYVNRGLSERQFVKRQDAEAARFRRQTLDAQFIDVQNRLVVDHQPARAGAARRLADMALTSSPDSLDVAGSPYPYFEGALGQLATLLAMDPSAPVRAAVIGGLERMARTRGGEGHAPLGMLIQELARANRQALAAFFESLAKVDALASDGPARDDKLLRLIERAVRRKPECCLDAMRRSSDYKSATFLPETVGAFATDRQMLSADDVMKLDQRWAGLVDTASTLASLLRRLDGDPQEPQTGPDLAGCFLAGQNLGGAQIACAKLKGAYLIDASMERSDLAGADLTSAHLQWASLYHANLQSALLVDAEIDAAKLIDTRLSGTVLYDLYWSETPPGGCPDFRRANWWDADFKHPLSDDEDDKLKAWMAQRWPKRCVDRKTTSV